MNCSFLASPLYFSVSEVVTLYLPRKSLWPLFKFPHPWRHLYILEFSLTAVWISSGFWTQLSVLCIQLAHSHTSLREQFEKILCYNGRPHMDRGAYVSLNERRGVISWSQGQSSLSCSRMLQSTISKVNCAEKTHGFFATAWFHSLLTRCF